MSDMTDKQWRAERMQNLEAFRLVQFDRQLARSVISEVIPVLIANDVRFVTAPPPFERVKKKYGVTVSQEARKVLNEHGLGSYVESYAWSMNGGSRNVWR